MAQDEATRSTKLYVQLFETHDDIGELEKCKLQDDAHAGEVHAPFGIFALKGLGSGFS